MKGWTLRETLLVMLTLSLLLVFLIPKYSIVIKRAVAQEALRTVHLIGNSINDYYIQTGTFTIDLEDMNLDSINDIENTNFKYSLEGASIDNYRIFAYGQKDSNAEGIKVAYSLPSKDHYIEYKGRSIEKSK